MGHHNVAARNSINRACEQQLLQCDKILGLAFFLVAILMEAGQHECSPRLSDIAGHLAQFGRVDAVGLRDIEDTGIPKADQDTRVLLGDVFLGFLVLPCRPARSRDMRAFGEPRGSPKVI